MERKSKGFIFVGSQKVPKPMLSQRELLGREKEIMRHPENWAGSLERKKRNEVWW